MLVWRLCRRPYADLSGDGGRRVSGRWHNAGSAVIYTAYEPALAILEVRVHLDLPFEDLPDDYVMMAIDLGNLPMPVPEPQPPEFKLSDTRRIGDSWLRDGTSPLLIVPSALAPHATNILINPLHPEAKAVTIAKVEAFKFDGRLWYGQG